jgi:hypothetical protein
MTQRIVRASPKRPAGTSTATYDGYDGTSSSGTEAVRRDLLREVKNVRHGTSLWGITGSPSFLAQFFQNFHCLLKQFA